MVRALALDLGDARIGVAVSDPLGLTARPLDPLRSIGPRKDLAQVEDLVRTWEADTVVIGLPLHLDGREGERSRAARTFAERLARRNPKLAVELRDERLSTVAAEDLLRERGVHGAERRRRVDGVAAALLLEGWLADRPRGEAG